MLKLMLSQILTADGAISRQIGLSQMEKWAIGLGASLVIACVVALIVWKVVIPKIQDKKENKDNKDKKDK